MKKQRGFTLISGIIILAIIAFFASVALKLVPMYQEYFGVVEIMNDMKTELASNHYSKQQVMTFLQRRIDIGYIDSVKEDNIEILRGKHTPYITKIVIDYEVRKPFVAQIGFIGHFHKEVDVEPKEK